MGLCLFWKQEVFDIASVRQFTVIATTYKHLKFSGGRFYNGKPAKPVPQSSFTFFKLHTLASCITAVSVANNSINSLTVQSQSLFTDQVHPLATRCGRNAQREDTGGVRQRQCCFLSFQSYCAWYSVFCRISSLSPPPGSGRRRHELISPADRCYWAPAAWTEIIRMFSLLSLILPF